MAFPPSADDLCDSAKEFARNSIDAHVYRKHHLVALYAGTSLEHLTKACLTRRSPALIVELRGEDSFRPLLLLLEITAGSTPLSLRTVGLRGALQRARLLITSSANWDHLMTLADMRDGTVHAAANDEVEEQLVVTFVQHANALLADLGRDRHEFWGPQLNVVNTLLADASDRTVHSIEVKLAAARAKFDVYDADLLQAIRQWADLRVLDTDYEAHYQCPACHSQGVATGLRDVRASDHERDPGGNVLRPILNVWFSAESFVCPICGLRLDSSAEITAAGMESTRDEGLPYDEDEDYERRREEHRRNRELCESGTPDLIPRINGGYGK